MSHNILYIIIIVVSVIVFFVDEFFKAAAANDLIPGLFKNRIGNVSARFNTEVTPANRTFLIWFVIDVYQALWLIYGLATICRKYKNGYLYEKPPYMPISIYIVNAINHILSIAWLLLWDREHFIPACIVIALMAFTCYLMMIASMRALDTYSQELVSQGFKKDVSLVIGLLHNGVGMYATWVTIATLVNLAVVIVYDGGVSNANGSSICLAFLGFELLLWTALDILLLSRYTRYLFTTYIVAIIALIGVIAGNWDPESRNSTFAIILLALSILAFFIKIFTTVRGKPKRASPGHVQMTTVE